MRVAGRFLAATALYLLAGICTPLTAAPPAWWAAYGAVSQSPADDLAAANQGQAKHVAWCAYLYLEDALADVGGAGPEVTALVQGFTGTHNLAPLRIGQLKWIAAPFYQRLQQFGYLSGHLAPGQPYPWGAVFGEPDDTALANLGQLKYAFQFDLDGWESYVDPWLLVPHAWKQQIVDFDPNDAIVTIDDVLPDDDFDGDGLSNWQEYVQSSNPASPDNPVVNLIIFTPLLP
jgi:hypothetical protein